ncbi:hypothetical protein niasHT_036351 [Heterodera trifolii]|uniref:Seven cysteines N-terminal domain-containing protein n=1 Tax=Heterodera trifolii TaxID=157864 RepID=A0ABD2IUD2_9BILA
MLLAQRHAQLNQRRMTTTRLFLVIVIIISVNLSPLVRSPFFCLGQSLCGELEIYKQQKWLISPATTAEGVRPLGTAEPSANLQQCLQQCCARPDCSAISFSGFLPLSSDSGNSSSSSGDDGTSSSASSSAANCALFECPADANSEIALMDATDAADQEGLLSVRLRRKDTQPPPTSPPTSNSNNTSSTEQQDDEEDDGQSAENGGDRRHILSLGNDGTSTEDGTSGGTTAEQQHQQQHQLSAEETPSTSARTPTTTTARKRTKSLLNFGTWDERFPLRAETTPVWAIGLAIVITVICLGLIASLFCAFLCYRRHKLRMRTLEFTGPKKMPTLHAFNPS